jgi:excisionase family DNA binding protein
MAVEMVTIERASLDVLIRQVSELNKSLRENKLQEAYTEILDGNEAAQYLKVSKRFLQLLRDKGEIVFYQKNLTIWYKRADLDKWLNAHKVGK